MEFWYGTSTASIEIRLMKAASVGSCNGESSRPSAPFNETIFLLTPDFSWRSKADVPPTTSQMGSESQTHSPGKTSSRYLAGVAISWLRVERKTKEFCARSQKGQGGCDVLRRIRGRKNWIRSRRRAFGLFGDCGEQW